MRRLWLIFAQTVTVSLAVVFVVSTLKPEWLGGSAPSVVALQEAPPSGEHSPPPASFREPARRALPSVVHIYTTQKVKPQRHPLFDDPIFRHFFGERPENDERKVALRAGGYCGPVVTDLHDAGHTHGLLTMVTCHVSDKYQDDDEEKGARIGKRLVCTPQIRNALRANANCMWFLHAVLPDFGGLEPHVVNAARDGADPTRKKRHAAITDRGKFKTFGDLGDVCKRQGDDEGSHFQRTFGSLVPTYWHPDHVRVPDDAPSTQPNFSAILTHAIYGE